MKTRLQFICLTFLLSLGSGLIAQSIVGTSWEAFVGTPPTRLELEFAVDDTMTIINPAGNRIPIATYQASGDTVTVTDVDPQANCLSPGVYQYLIQNNTLTLTAISDTCTDRVNFMVNSNWVRSGIGLDGFGLPDLMSVYPNPAQAVLKVDLFEPASLSYSIIDLSGRIILTGKILQESNQIDIEQLPKGIYFLKISEWGQSIRFNKI